MAKSGAKKQHEANKAQLKLLASVLNYTTVFHVVVRLCVRYKTAKKWNVVFFACTLLACRTSLTSLRSFAAPTYDADGELIDGGGSLRGGLTEYYQDLIYVGAFALTATTYSDWFWMSMLIIPAVGGYLIITKLILPYMSMKKQASEASAQEETKEEKRRRERSQRRQAKRRGF
uniref:Transmembrane protein 208 n=1 Tax=Ostreococcus mediterraneus TaxID=1486918 RepID=A0A7S0PLY3_9CHLO